jgi:uncharacterized protein (TIGR03086 family)
MDLVRLHESTVRSWLARVAAVRDDQWALPTPCSEWSVRDLVNHVVGEELWTVPLLAGKTVEDVGDAYDGDLLGAEPISSAEQAAAAAIDAAAKSPPSGGVVHLTYGDDSIENYLHQLCADHLVHGWDLAAATGQSRQLDPNEVAAVAAWFADWEEAYRSSGAVGQRGASGGDTQSDLLAGFGRDANWTVQG